MERANTKLEAIATTAAEAIEEVCNNKADAPVWVSATLAVNSWVNNTDTAVKNAGYNFMCDTTVPGVTVYDSAESIISPESVIATADCGMCPTTEVMNGKVRFYAINMPTANITVQIRPIIKIREENQ